MCKNFGTCPLVYIISGANVRFLCAHIKYNGELSIIRKVLEQTFYMVIHSNIAKTSYLMKIGVDLRFINEKYINKQSQILQCGSFVWMD